jgi:PAS domain S-box-containing protein
MDRSSPKEPPLLNKGTQSLPDVLTKMAAAYAILGGMITLAGWVAFHPRLCDWLGQGICMYPNAALCSIAAGSALLFLKNSKTSAASRLLVRLLAGFVILISGLAAYEHHADDSLWVDDFLSKGTWGDAAGASALRMGLPSTWSFLLLGCALVISTGKLRLCCHHASALGLIAMAISSLSLVGYWFGANQLYGLARYTGISWQGASMIFALGLGLVAAMRECGFMALLMRPDAGGLMVRRFILPIILTPLLLGWARIQGVEHGIFDDTFGTALRTLLSIAIFLGVLWSVANSLSHHASLAREATRAHVVSEQRFIGFMQALPGLAWIKDSDGCYVYANEAFQQALAKNEDEIYGLRDGDFMPEHDAEKYMKNDRLTMKENAGLQFVETLRKCDGHRHSFLVTKFPMPSGTDGAPFIGGIAIDITDRLRAEQELKEAHHRKDEFLATLAHELRNPLSPIRCSVEICRDQPDPEKLSWALNVIDRQVRQMARLLDDLLDLSRISYGKLTLRCERVELSRIIAGAAETSQPLREKAEQSLDIQLPAEPVFLHADPMRLEQVFGNLLNNAAKYGGKGSKVVLTATIEDDNVQVSVRDNGVGIPPELLEDIFKMFSQVKSPTSGPAVGLGIGLSLVQGLVKLHSGRIEARSEGSGSGSEFIVTLPLHPDHHLPEKVVTAPPAAESPPEPEPEAPLLRLLITDDLRDSADSLSACFHERHYDVRTAYNGDEALAVAEAFRPHIMFLDIGMPHMSGDEVCRRIREKEWGKDIFIVAITGWGQESDRRLTKEAGFDYHLVKPIELNQLLSIISGIAARDHERDTLLAAVD